MTHIKRLATPRTWPIKRKQRKWVTRPNPGPHPLKRCVSLDFLLKEILHYAQTKREVKIILNQGKVAIDNKIRKDPKFPVGLFDIVSLKDVNEHFRVFLNKKGKLMLYKIKKEEASIKLRKVIKKTTIKRKRTQINFYDGANKIVASDSYAVSDTLVFTLTKNEIQDHLKFEKGAVVYITDGKQTGAIGIIDSISKPSIHQQKIVCKKGKEKFETLKEYAFVVGKEKPVIAIPENE